MSDPDATPTDPALEALLLHVQGLPEGERPDLDVLAREHPELIDRIRELVVDMDSAYGKLAWTRSRQTPEMPRLRVTIEEEIARGGMGVVHRATDVMLRRTLAVKILTQEDPTGAAHARFREEAQVTAQLDHPGVPSVHELGTDPSGRPAMTMKLVRGRTLRELLPVVDGENTEWSLVRLLGLLIRVCDAVAYAHGRGVVHRDLKPSNIMVGRFGEVYVMDWGLSLVHGRPLAPRTPDKSAASQGIQSDRGEVRDHTPDSPLITLEGYVVGTPLYMSLEQAQGEGVGPSTDIYAVGAILYEMLAGRPAYLKPGTSASPRTILKWVIDGPPAPITEVASRTAPELVAICERAMERDVAKRYQTVSALGDDLRAYLENRVVAAHRTGAMAELRMWIRRNKKVAVTALVGLVLAGAAAYGMLHQRLQRMEVEARVLAEHTLGALESEYFELGPMGPGTRAAREAWLARADALRRWFPELARDLAELEVSGRVVDSDPAAPTLDEEELAIQRARRVRLEGLLDSARDELASPDVSELDGELRTRYQDRAVIIPKQLQVMEKELARVQRRLDGLRRFEFEDPRRARDHAALQRLVFGLQELHEEDGLAARVRSELAQIADEVRGEADRSSRWSAEVTPRIAGNPIYKGLDVRPQAGLEPLGPNDFGLEEFWHVLSGDRPSLTSSGQLKIVAETGVVLVLIPSGTFAIGAQGDDPDGPRYVADIRKFEACDERVFVSGFFLSKYEITQAQWLRLNGRNPSGFVPGMHQDGNPIVSFSNPVEQVSWVDATRELVRWGLSLPTEAQWELAARAGTDYLLFGSDDLLSLAGHANFADWSPLPDGLEADGFLSHARVDAMAPNAFGLFHMLGNVAEWCQEPWLSNLRDGRYEGRRGLRVVSDTPNRVVRGDSYLYAAGDLRTTKRDRREPRSSSNDIGVRPVRMIQ